MRRWLAAVMVAATAAAFAATAAEALVWLAANDDELDAYTDTVRGLTREQRALIERGERLRAAAGRTH